MQLLHLPLCSIQNIMRYSSSLPLSCLVALGLGALPIQAQTTNSVAQPNGANANTNADTTCEANTAATATIANTEASLVRFRSMERCH